jgi:hypothetical protein
MQCAANGRSCSPAEARLRGVVGHVTFRVVLGEALAAARPLLGR